MTTSAKKGDGTYSWDEAGQVFGPDGQMIAQISLNVRPDEREALAQAIAQALPRADGPAEPSAPLPAGSDAAEQRSFDSIELSGRVYFERGFDRADPPSVAIPRAFMAGAALAVGPLARAIIDQAWGEAHEDESVPSSELQDRILGAVIGEFGPVLAWPNVPDKCPTFGEVAEIAVALVAEAAKTEKAWRERGIADQKPDEFAFILSQLEIHRAAGAMLRQLAMVVLGQQGEAIEQTRIIRAGLEAIRTQAIPGRGAKAIEACRRLAGELLSKLGDDL